MERQMKKQICYKVKVKTTNGLGNTVKISTGYLDCEYGILFYITENPHEILDIFSVDNILSIERVGIGYCKHGMETNETI